LIDQLTQEQQWGWAYLLQLHNEQISKQNDALEEANSILPEGQAPIEPQPLFTIEQFLAMRLARIGDDGYRQILRVKEQQALAMFYALSPEQQDALIAQFNIPPVLQGDE